MGKGLGAGVAGPAGKGIIGLPSKSFSTGGVSGAGVTGVAGLAAGAV